MDKFGTDRRAFVQSLAAAALLAAPARTSAFGHGDVPGFIDIHHHCVPDVYRDSLAARGIDSVGRVPLPPWSLQQTLSEMDELGIAKAILSLSAPGVYFGDQPFATELARRVNDRMAEFVSENPRRIGGFATLPLPDVDAALLEWERTRSAGHAGVILLTNYGGKYLGHDDFAPLLDELSRQEAVIFLHPTLPAGVEAFDLSLPPPILEFVFDTTRTLADMIFSGALDRYSGAQWIAAHLAGTLPFIAGRLSLIEQSPRDAYAAFRERGRSVESYLGDLYYDTAVSASPASLAATLHIVGADRLVFGSDRPFLPMAVARDMGHALIGGDLLSAEDVARIGRGNAAALLPPGRG